MIDTKSAKARFLSLAFQGQLVAFSRQEIQNDALENLHKKQKNYSPVSESEYLINTPSNWNWSRLGYVTSNHGQIIPNEDFCYIDVGTLDNVHQRLSETENIVSSKDAPSRARKVVQDGDVLYSTVRPYLHNICIVDRQFSRIPIASTAFCVMQPDNTVLLSKFLFYWLLTPEFDKFSNGDPSKGTLYPAIGEKDLLRGVIPIPPLAEQSIIIERLEAAFIVLDTIDNLQSQYFNNQAVLKEKLIDAAIRGKLTEQLPEDGNAEELYRQIQKEKNALIEVGKIRKKKPLSEIKDEEIPFIIPQSWMWVRWGSMSYQIQYGYNAPAKDKGRIRMVRITDIQDNKVDWKTVPFCDIDEESIGQYSLKPNNILFARTGGTVGKSFLVENIENEAVFAGYLIRTSFSDQLNAKYMKYYMDSRLYWKQLHDGTTATAQPNCNANTLSKMIVPIPPISEQKRIVSKLEELLNTLETEKSND